MLELPQENSKESISIKWGEKRDLAWEERIPLQKGYAEKFNLSGEEAEALDYYLFFLDLNVNELVGKKVLDIGSGRGSFKKALQKIVEIKDGEFVNFDLNVFDEEEKQSINVLGTAETLPFKDESFDFVLANFSVPVMQATAGIIEVVPQTLEEMTRVVRKNGVIKVYPVGGEWEVAAELQEEQLYRKLFPIVLEEVKKMISKKLISKAKITKFTHESPGGGYDNSLEIIK